MKYYLNGVGLLIFVILTIGFIVPTAVSAKDTLAVLGGLTWVLASPVVVWYWLRKVFIKKVPTAE